MSVIGRKCVFEISRKNKPNENKGDRDMRVQTQGNLQTLVLGALFW